MNYINVLKEIGFPDNSNVTPEKVQEVLDRNGYRNYRTPNSKLEAFLMDYFTNAPVRLLPKTKLKFVSDVIIILNENLNTQAGVFGRLRKVLKQRFTPKMYDVTRYSFTAGKEANLRRNEQLVENRRNKTPIQVEVQDFVDSIRRLAGSHDVYENVLALARAIGSRKAEVLKVSEYSLVEGKPNMLRVKGIAKRGEAGLNIQVDKPVVGISPEVFLELVEKVRGELQGELQQMVGSVVPGIVNSGLATMTSRNGFSRAFQTARDAYANVSYEIYADKSVITKPAWIQDVLAHKNMETSINYAASRVADRRLGDKVDKNTNSIEELKEVDEKQEEKIETLQNLQAQAPRKAKTVTVMLQDGTFKTYKKLPRRHDGDNIERAYNLVVTMVRDGYLPPNRTALRAIGVGASFVNDVWNMLKANGVIE